MLSLFQTQSHITGTSLRHFKTQPQSKLSYFTVRYQSRKICKTLNQKDYQVYSASDSSAPGW